MVSLVNLNFDALTSNDVNIARFHSFLDINGTWLVDYFALRFGLLLNETKPPLLPDHLVTGRLTANSLNDKEHQTHERCGIQMRLFQIIATQRM